MQQSSGRPATKIEIEAMTAIANLQDENRTLKLKIQELIDATDQAEAEREDACNLRNFAYIELEEVQAENKKLREMAKAMVKWERVALEWNRVEALGEEDLLESYRAFQSGLMLSLATRLAKEVLEEGEVELDILKQIEERYRQAESDAELLNWLESAMRKCLGRCPWYSAAGDVHLGKPLREALTEAMLKDE